MVATMPRRVTVTLPDTVASDLQKWADRRGQALATCAALAIEMATEALKEKGEIQTDTVKE